MSLITDPVGDTLIRIQNGYLASRAEVLVPFSKMSEAIVKILKDHGFIEDFKKKNSPEGYSFLTVYLYEKGKRAFSEVKQISKPGRRIYVNAKKIPYVRDGFGICLLSTPKGIISGREARRLNVGGELLAKIW